MKRLNQIPTVELLHNRAVYDSYYAENTIDGWDTEDKFYNFAIMGNIAIYAGFPLRGASILDVGCGTGDLIHFLRKYGFREYLGIDIYGPALAMARKKYPNERFLQTDILSDPLPTPLDYVFCSGAMSIKMKTTDNYDFLAAMIDKMWHIARYGLVFNFLSDEDPEPDQALFYYNKEKVVKLCQKIAPKAHVLLQDTPIKTKGVVTDYQSHVFMYH